MSCMSCAWQAPRMQIHETLSLPPSITNIITFVILFAILFYWPRSLLLSFCLCL